METIEVKELKTRELMGVLADEQKIEANRSSFTVVVSKRTAYVSKRHNFATFWYNESMRMDFPRTKEGALQALFTNYVQRKRLRDTMDALVGGKVIEYNCDIHTTSADIDFPSEEVEMKVSLPNYEECVACVAFDEFEDAVYKYDELKKFGFNIGSWEYERQMRSIAKCDYRKSSTHPEESNDFMQIF